MKLIINGEEKNIDQEKVTVSEILAICKVEMPEMVSVQRNGVFVERTAFSSTQILSGDEIDFLYFMGGGQ